MTTAPDSTNPNATRGGSWCSCYVVAASRLVPLPASPLSPAAELLPEWLKRSKPLTHPLPLPADDPRTPAEVASERHPGLSRLGRGLAALLDETERQPDGLRQSRRSVVKTLFPEEAERVTAILERRHPLPHGLKTAAQAAAKLGCSIKTLNGHIASGALRYVVIGHGTKRPRKMFTDPDLDAFVAHQTRKDSPACRSTASRARRSGTSTSSGEVIAFSAQPRPRLGAKPKK